MTKEKGLVLILMACVISLALIMVAACNADGHHHHDKHGTVSTVYVHPGKSKAPKALKGKKPKKTGSRKK